MAIRQSRKINRCRNCKSVRDGFWHLFFTVIFPEIAAWGRPCGYTEGMLCKKRHDDIRPKPAAGHDQNHGRQHVGNGKHLDLCDAESGGYH